MLSTVGNTLHIEMYEVNGDENELTKMYNTIINDNDNDNDNEIDLFRHQLFNTILNNILKEMYDAKGIILKQKKNVDGI